MDSASIKFVIFGLIVAVLSNLSRSRIWRSLVLAVATGVFLYLLVHKPVLMLPLFGFLALGYLGILLLRAGMSRSVTFSVLAVLLAYVWLKKYTFIPAALFLHHPYFTLGLSYIFFRVLQLLIEAGDPGGVECRNIGPFAYLLYTLNFTTFVSGPLQRYEDFAADQFAVEPISLGIRTVGLQLDRIIRGFFKVNVLGMALHAFQLDALSQLSYPASPAVKMWAIARIAVIFPFFLYCNFSGYIDIVIALARLMRVRLPENFNRPFSATSFIEFWSRWHMTLSNWLKNYVYNPLLLNLMRRVTSREAEPYLAVIAFFVTFFLIGIWHGRTSEFAVFGILQGGGVAINKLWQIQLQKRLGRKGYRELSNQPVYDAFGRGLTFTWFAFTLFWFWGAWVDIGKAFHAIDPLRELLVWLGIWVAATVVLAAWERLRQALLAVRVNGDSLFVHRYARAAYCSVMLTIAVALLLLNQPAPDIVYKAF